jgi:hypothetical protein
LATDHVRGIHKGLIPDIKDTYNFNHGPKAISVSYIVSWLAKQNHWHNYYIQLSFFYPQQESQISLPRSNEITST